MILGQKSDCLIVRPLKIRRLALAYIAQWSSHPPEVQNNWVRIPPLCKVCKGKHSNAVVKMRSKGIGPQFFNPTTNMY
jgi:hypothetical protein